MLSAALASQHFHLQALRGKFYGTEIGAARFQTVCRHSQGAGIALRRSLLHGFKQPGRIAAKQRDGFFQDIWFPIALQRPDIIQGFGIDGAWLGNRAIPSRASCLALRLDGC